MLIGCSDHGCMSERGKGGKRGKGGREGEREGRRHGGEGLGGRERRDVYIYIIWGICADM